jgi:murein DD-endopeptidase MepM/ murein hydrolase activator NlpD
MKQTLTRTWAILRQYEGELALGLVMGLFLGTVNATQDASYQAHFLQRANKPTQKVTLTAVEVRRSKRVVQAVTDTEPVRPASPKRVAQARSARSAENQRSASPLAQKARASQATSAAPRAVAIVHAISSVTTEPLRAAAPDFPALERAVHPVSKVPNWGAMRSPAEWDRTYREMTSEDFVAVPAYNLRTLTIPMSTLAKPSIQPESIPAITAKLYYSTRYKGSYDIDAGEHSGSHDGVDLKLALGTPLGAIAGGRVVDVLRNETLGLHVLIEHRTDGERYLSIYGHLGSASVEAQQDVTPGQTIGTVGMTGNTSGPHLHLAVHRAAGDTPWSESLGESINPMTFIAQH